jgi:hypothetical protein
MSVIVWGVKIALVLSIIGGIIALLPDAPPGSGAFTIPDVIWNPLVAVLSLNRYLPIGALLAVLVAQVTIQTVLATLWLTSWVWKLVSP